MNNINDCIQEIYRYKGVFDPSKEYYLEFMFRYSCQYLERLGVNPAHEPNRLMTEIHNRITETLDMTRKSYWKHTTHTLIYCPDFAQIPNLIDYDIPNRKKLLQ